MENVLRAERTAREKNHVAGGQRAGLTRLFWNSSDGTPCPSSGSMNAIKEAFYEHADVPQAKAGTSTRA
jgi:hypothetical protein